MVGERGKETARERPRERQWDRGTRVREWEVGRRESTCKEKHASHILRIKPNDPHSPLHPIPHRSVGEM